MHWEILLPPCTLCAMALRESRGSSLLIQLDCFDGHVPVRFKNGETALLFMLVGILVRKHLFLECLFVEGFVGDRGVLEDYGDAVVPTAILGRVIARLVHPDLHHAA